MSDSETALLERGPRHPTPSASFHHVTERYLAEASLDHRKKLGQYFTPKPIRERLLDLLPKGNYRRILDPSCGTGEFLLSAHERYPSAEIVGWEIDPVLARLAKNVAPFAQTHRRDALEIPDNERESYDLVIGNPPYFEWKPDSQVRERFQHVISGRPNIFAFFFAIGLDLIREGGILAYVVPQSMNNGAYFRSLRQHIVSRGGVVALEPLEDQDLFQDAQQTVMLLVVEKGRRSSRFTFQRNGIVIFSPDPTRLERAFKGKVTLGELGYAVRTGSIVWNQHKEHLSRTPKNAYPLLWAHNIGPEGLRFPVDHPKRPQYVRAKNPVEGPAILVNRITGAASRATLRAAVVPEGMKFFGENHVNIVFPPEAVSQMRLGLFGRCASASIEKVAKAIQSPDAIDAIRLVTGNTQVSATELTHLLPLAL